MENMFFYVCLFLFFCFLLRFEFNCILTSRRRRLDKEGVDIDDAEDEIVVDAAAGPKFFQVMQGVCPCITKARGGQLCNYLLQAGRHVNNL